ncbi:hypothetical protein SAMN04487970_104250 [Paenibacillus tianmuensis]|uniref:SWIM-type domain-containing protein n=1 Tax=Paenibacillus tianmuensis TaxID=624147 RepID=A0A1G4T590_9BACL|nr:hypothetical protein [Paenibacillus tianmuensis]SCW76347.1 hypothetical protein SAMN04487970_104250 [Paenibacillus tianmuensis]
MLQLSMNSLVKEVYRYFSYPILERGWHYYSNDSVIDLDEDEANGMYYASVADPDGEVYFADIVPTSLKESQCDCGKNYCAHLSAGLFELCERLGLEPYKLLKPGGSAWKDAGQKAASSGETGSLSATQIRSSGTNAAGPKKPPLASVPQPNSGVESWHRYFESQIPLDRIQSIQGLHAEISRKLLPHANGWKPTLRSLYALHIQLFAMTAGDRVLSSLYQFRYNFFNSGSIDELHAYGDEIYRHVGELVRGADQGDLVQHRTLLDETAAYLAAHAFQQVRSSMPWGLVYSTIWWNLLWDEERMDREKARLNRAARNEVFTPVQADQIVAALIMFDLRVGNDQAAMKKTGRIHLHVLEVMLPFLNSFIANEQWERIISWLEFLIPAVKASRYYGIGTYFQLWDQVNQHVQLEERWKKAVFELMPGSFSYYAQTLLNRNLLQEWVDLHMAAGFMPTDFRAAELKPVESKRKDFLLPWYHYSVERCIAEKNRNAYKAAVRMMKKLKQMYKNLKQTDRWERYLEHTTVKYSRLRAFQEELAKLRSGGDGA